MEDTETPDVDAPEDDQLTDCDADAKSAGGVGAVGLDTFFGTWASSTSESESSSS